MKKYQKGFIFILCAALMLFAFSGCAAKKETESAATDTIVEGTQQETPADGNKPQVVPPSGTTTPTAPGTPPNQNNSTVTQPNNNQSSTHTPTKPEENNKPNKEPGKEPEQGDHNMNNTPLECNLKIMNFNVRCANDPNGHSIAERAPRVKDTINRNDPDLIGMEEVVPEWDKQLQSLMGDTYEVLTHYRSASNPEGHSILYKKSAFELIDEDFFWLSDTPNQESIAWGGSHIRILTWARLKQKSTGKTILFMVYHGNGDDTWANNAYQQIFNFTQRYKSCIPFLAGDFNRDPQSNGMVGFLSLFDEARTTVPNPTTPPNTMTCPGGYPNPDAEAPGIYLFDFILHREEQAQALDYTIDMTRYNGYFASDHYALITAYHVL